MKSLGMTMFVLGTLSCGLHFFDKEFLLLMWIDMWGIKMAWVIRGALIVVGLVIWGRETMQEVDITEEQE